MGINKTKNQKLQPLIFTATYNESGNIENLIKRISEFSPQCDILVIDDNSPDKTGEILEQIAKKNKRLKVIHRSGKLGLGSAHKQAMEYAIDNDYNFLITMDADFSHNPKDINRLLEKVADSDFVIGSRYAIGGSSDYSGYRLFVSKFGNILARFLLQIKLTEFTTSFRAFSVEMLRKMNLNKIESDGYSFFLEVVFLVHRFGFSLSEIPIHFSDRAAGESKISKIQIIYSLITLAKFTLKRWLVPVKKLKDKNFKINIQ